MPLMRKKIKNGRWCVPAEDGLHFFTTEEEADAFINAPAPTPEVEEERDELDYGEPFELED